jgi:hypothetical protein
MVELSSVRSDVERKFMRGEGERTALCTDRPWRLVPIDRNANGSA